MIINRRSAVSLLLAVGLLPAVASVAPGQAAPADSLERSLGEVEVSATVRRQPRVGADGGVSLDASMLDAAPRMFGEADLIRLMKSTAGVTGTSDYSSGASVDGMDYSQTLYTLNGVPVEFPYHFGGIFSTFNSTHYPRLRLWKSNHPAGSPDCLGGIVATAGAADTPRHPFTGTLNAGMTASSATLRLAPERLDVMASGRVSYINALYRPLLDTGHADIAYDFLDLDLDARYRLGGDMGTVRVFGHYNADRLGYDDRQFAMNTRMRWHNTVAGARWTWRSGELTAGYSALANRLVMALPQLDMAMPSSSSTLSLRGHHDLEAGNCRVRLGAAVERAGAKPQSVTLEGFGSFQGTPSGPVPSRRGVLSKIHGSVTVALPRGFSLDAGLDANAWWGSGRFRQTDIDPRLTLAWRDRLTTVSLHLGRYHQYVHQVGFSEIGMASNFKVPADGRCRPQEALTAVIAAGRFIDRAGVRLSADIYVKRVVNQPEYLGGVLDLLNTDYAATDYIEMCRGWNAGGSVTAVRDFSRLTASATYAYCLARRRAGAGGEWFTASSETRNSLNLSASYRFPGNRWAVSAAFAYATGRPVTPVTAVYLIGERIMVEYGRRNSSNLPAYHRLDLGATYRFTTGRLNHLVALSVINAYGHRNVEISTYAFNLQQGTLRRREVSSLYRFLPSLSYTVSF